MNFSTISRYEANSNTVSENQYQKHRKKQLEKLIKEELIDELLTVNSIHEDLAKLTSKFDEFLEKYT